MSIVFYNTFAIGDSYFNKPFLKHLCDNNPSRKFKIHTNIASFFFKDIPNLTQLDEEDHPHHHPQRYLLFKYFEQHSKTLMFQADEQTLCVNTWVTVLNPLIEPLNCECHPANLYLAFQRLVEEINMRIPDKLEFPPLDKREFVYKMPSFPLERFLEFKRDVGKEVLFYFNRMGMSASSKPFTTEEDHRKILEALANLYPEKIIVVPNMYIMMDRPNVIPTRLFGSIEDHTCENVLFDMEIAGHSTYAILFDIGSCFTYCNSRFASYPAKFLHMSKEPRFCTLIKDNLQECLDLDTSQVDYVPCSTPEEVISEIQKRIV